jgi:hypothetical protein
MNFAPYSISPIKPSPSSSANAVALHATLAAFNSRRLTPSLPDPRWRERMSDDAGMLHLESLWLMQERERQRDRAAEAPTDPDGFVAWFEDLRDTGPGQNDALFPYLAEQATLDELRWFLAQEVQGEAGFDDLVALTQVRMPPQAKLEMARNYWDEMGRGNPKGMHGPMLNTLAEALDVRALADPSVWEATALNNLMVGLALNRGYAYHSTGALGAIELTAPGRSKHVSLGLRRLGVPADARHYFELHATLDIKHAEAWNREVFRSIVAATPQAASALAEGALMRLYCGQRCFERYRRHFGI